MIVCLFLDSEEKRYFPDDVRELIRELAERTETEVRQILPGIPDEIELAVQTGAMVIPETGANGTAISAQRVVFTVDPARPGGITAVASEHLRHTLYHEFHHLARSWVIFPPLQQERFIDGVVAEGLASAFERDFAGYSGFWHQYSEEVGAWVDELLPLPVTAPIMHWMYMHPDGRRAIGYRAGTYIADRAMAESGLSAADLVNTAARDVLRFAKIEG
jgi:uncharacterized protein YjaZ